MTYGNFQCAYDERTCKGEVGKVEKQRNRRHMHRKLGLMEQPVVAQNCCQDGFSVGWGRGNLFCFILCFFSFSFVILILCLIFYLLLGEGHKGGYGRTGK